jgi:hypothetical protein
MHTAAFCSRVSIGFITLLFALAVTAFDGGTPEPRAGGPENEHGLSEATNDRIARADPNRRPTAILDLVRDLPANAPTAMLLEATPELLSEIGRSNRRELPLVREAIALLRSQENVVAALAKTYENLPQEAFQRRLLVLQVVGETQRLDALHFLREVAWGPLPPASYVPCVGLSPRDYEEIIQSKAVQCIAYLRDDNGDYDPAVTAEVEKLILAHQSPSVRINAIDAYMWNRRDSQWAALTLYRKLPKDYRKYVARPRFDRGKNRDVFISQLETWRKRWVER